MVLKAQDVPRFARAESLHSKFQVQSRHVKCGAEILEVPLWTWRWSDRGLNCPTLIL